MRIESNGYHNQCVRQAREATPADSVHQASQKERPEGVVSLSLSARSRELALAREKLDEMPPVREDLVRELRAQVVEGVYRPSSQQIARRMLAELGAVLKG